MINKISVSSMRENQKVHLESFSPLVTLLLLKKIYKNNKYYSLMEEDDKNLSYYT